MSLHDGYAESSDDLTGTFQHLSVCKGPPPQEQRSRTTADGVHFQPTFAMYPLMLQAPVGPTMPYMFDRFSAAGQTSPLAPMSPPYPVLGHVYQTPPSPALTTQNNQSPSRPVSVYSRIDARRQNATRINRSPHHNAAGHHNHVDIQRIRDGIDVRTTVRSPVVFIALLELRVTDHAPKHPQ
jgi:hypothetical protein